MPIAGSCCIRCRTLSLLPACLRLVFPSSRLISSIVVSLVVSPFFDTVGRGVRRGDVGALGLLGFSLRSVPMSIGRFMLYLPAMSPRSACLSSRLRGRWCSHLIMLNVLRCPCLPVVSFLSSFAVPPVWSSHLVYLAPSCDTMGGEAGGCGEAIRFSFYSPFACLPRIIPRHPSDTDGGGGLRSIGSACSACLPRCIRAVPLISSRISAASSPGSFD